ncbi:hypothetical protein [Streptomyces sp. NPDC056663]|uniref:hypothetical protein n=1 Tax=Streptomyces sp. NPDC056663 TaxID=3345899 RepID=UPI0036B40B4A
MARADREWARGSGSDRPEHGRRLCGRIGRPQTSVLSEFFQLLHDAFDGRGGVDLDGRGGTE